MTRKQFVIISLVIVAFLGLTWYSVWRVNSTPEKQSLQEIAEQKENEAIKARYQADDERYQNCLNKYKGGSKSFSEDQRKAYECFTSGTGNLTPVSEVPIQGIITKVSAAEFATAPPVEGKDTKQAKSEKPSPSVSTKSTPAQTVEKSSSIDDKYWKAYDTAIAQIHKWEGIRLTAYWDHRGYSIGYGSRAKSSTEKITKAEADRRLVSIVKPLLAKVQKDFPTLHPEAQGALVSFAYNCHKGYESVRKNGLKYHGQWCKTASGKRYDGLVQRRAEESRLIFKK